MEVALEVCPEWTVLPEHRRAIGAIFNWCMDLPGPLLLHKGLWLCGNNGTGKTTLLQIVKRFCPIAGKLDMNGNPYGFRITNALEVCSRYEQKGDQGIETYIREPRQAFDELGAESIPSGYFGCAKNVMQHILLGRYDRRFGGFTHVATNLDFPDVMGFYGPRVYDRIKEMFNFILLKGTTFRGEIQPL